MQQYIKWKIKSVEKLIVIKFSEKAKFFLDSTVVSSPVIIRENGRARTLKNI